LELDQTPGTWYIHLGVRFSFCLIISTESSLGRALDKARETADEQVDYFLGLSIARGEACIRLWEKEATEPRFKNGEWQSVYRVETSKRMFSLNYFTKIIL